MGAMGQEAERIVAQAESGLARVLARTDPHRDADLGDAYQGRRVADVLAHLHAWHVLFEGWVTQHRSGAVPAFPAEGYSWHTLGDLNDALHRAHHDRTYEEIRALLVTSHHRMIALVRELDDATLGSPGALAWLGDASLGSVAHECLGAHYAWAERVLDDAGVPTP
ncbi:hypothetical protein Lsed01_02212 [Demequina sediminis]|uniref:ClbS/DfsB family four-helix bundle protein n=2 Tax=Demequina sediminis TaxID=1930058 RepID=A0ABP9WIV9_9MICO|nr:hypothetical protein GCM10025873_02780 [Demequina sediminis]